MSQRAKPVDLTRSYLPIDPASFPETMHGTSGEDAPEKLPPVTPYEGWNFMPTPYGYRSYFGITGKLNIDALATPARTRELFVVQKEDLSNVLVALADDGIWTKGGEAVGAWTHAIILIDPNDGTVKEWSYCVIDNVLYVYRQGEASYWKYSLATAYVFTAVVPTTLNMAGQLGIFAAGSRLGFWDSANAIGYSAFDDLSYFTPDIGKGSNITSLNDLIGKIITIEQHGDGFIVYATRSIIGVVKDVNSTFLWKAVPISKIAGIAYRHQVDKANPDNIHFAWTNVGLMRIENFQFQIVAPELYDYIKEAKSPVYLKFLEGRYLAVQLSNADYVDGQITFYTQTIPGITIDLSTAVTTYLNQPDPTTTASLTDSERNLLMRAIDREMPHLYAVGVGGGCANQELSYCTGKDYPLYRDKIMVPMFDLSLNPIAQQKAIDLGFGEDNKGQVLFDGTLYSFSPSYLPAGIWVTEQAKYDIIGHQTEITDGLYLFPLTLNAIDASIPGYANVLQIPESDCQIDVDNEQNFFQRVAAIYNRYETFVQDWLSKFEAQAPALYGIGVSQYRTVTDDTYELILAVKPDVGVDINIYGSYHNVGTVAANQGAFAATPGKEEFLFSVVTAWDLEYGVYQDTFPYVLARPKTNHVRVVSQLPYTFGLIFRDLTGALIPGGVAVHSRILATTGVAAGLPTPVDKVLVSELDNFDVVGYSGIENYLDSTIGGFNSINVAVVGTTLYDTIKYPTISGLKDLLATDAAVGDNSTLADKYKSVTISGTYGGNPWSVTLQFYLQQMEGRDLLGSFGNDTNVVTPYCDIRPLLSYSYIDSFFQFNLDGSTVASATIPPAVNEDTLRAQGACLLGTDARAKPMLNGMTIVNPYQGQTIYDDPYNFPILDGTFTSTPPSSNTFTFPGTTFLLQVGSPTPYDITWKGAYVYDTYLKRWGKMKQDYRLLLDFYPINSNAEKTINFTRFGVEAAMLNSLGEIRLFDIKPTDSYIKYGKIGLFRYGTTCLEEIRADFRQALDVTLQVETSIDGLSVESGLTKEYTYTGVRQISQGIGSSGKWHNISFKGAFDLSYLEFRSWLQGRR